MALHRHTHALTMDNSYPSQHAPVAYPMSCPKRTHCSHMASHAVLMDIP